MKTVWLIEQMGRASLGDAKGGELASQRIGPTMPSTGIRRLDDHSATLHTDVDAAGSNRFAEGR